MIKRIAVVVITAIFYTIPTLPQSIAEDMNALLTDPLFRDSDVSLAIYDLDADTLLFAHREHKLCRPASTLKLLTSVVAIERLGCDYMVCSRLYEKENASGGTNIYIRGEIDPLFGEEDLSEMLSAIPAGTRIDTLFADCTFMDSVYWGAGWSWDDTPWEFQPYISPLMLCGGCVEVSAKPSAKGEPPHVECKPKSSFYTVENEAVSHGGRGEKFTILRDWLNNSNVIRLRGDCNIPKSEKMNICQSQDYFIRVAEERLFEKGVEVSHSAFAQTPTDATLLHCKQRPIRDIVSEALMESNNLCAEALSYHLGGLYGKFPVHREMGPEIVEAFLEYTLDINDEYNIADGSGLSLYNYISADMLLQVLRHSYLHPQIHDIVYNSLPVTGVSGTMKHRAKGTAAYKRVHAKTGTVKGVCTLAGYAKAANGHTLAFVILNQNSMDARDVRLWQDKVCDAMCR